MSDSEGNQSMSLDYDKKKAPKSKSAKKGKKEKSWKKSGSE